MGKQAVFDYIEICQAAGAVQSSATAFIVRLSFPFDYYTSQPYQKGLIFIWVSDITYLPLINGEWAYLGSWMDLFSRRIVGWRVDDNMEPGRRSG